jgi:hypothetical protein
MDVDSEYLGMWRRYLEGYPYDASVIPLETALASMTAQRLKGEKFPIRRKSPKCSLKKLPK